MDADASRRLTVDFSEPERLRLSETFMAAEPFAHVVIDNFLSEAGRTALRDFPAPDWPHWRRFFDEYQKEKRVCADMAYIPGPFADLIHECSQPGFLGFLERLTSVVGLLTDPYLEGGGLHCSGPGGILTPHTDFHYYRKLSLYRILNLLIYFNDPWEAEDGGCLELYQKGADHPAVCVAPKFGRAVIFKTDDRSVHGFSHPVAAGRWRNSLALYYYTSREGRGYAGDTTTHWQTHGALLRGPRLALFEALMFASRAFSKLAYFANPNSRVLDQGGDKAAMLPSPHADSAPPPLVGRRRTPS
ncbi:MAG TPA: 2OG-Fe(II) oxygenase [Caulobacteraceae bacterium]